VTVLAGALIAALYFSIAEVIYKKITGRYFDFGFGVSDRDGIIITFIVVILSLSTGPLIISFFTD